MIVTIRAMRRGLLPIGVAATMICGCGGDAGTEPDPRPSIDDALEGLVYERKYTVDATFPTGVQLEVGSDVRIGGVNVGSVGRVDRAGTRVEAALAIDDELAPISSNARAILRQRTLYGDAYVELTPGGAPGGASLQGSIADGVRRRELLQAFTPKLRRGFREFERENGFEPRR